MKKTITVQITLQASKEVLETILTGSEGKKTTIDRIHFEPAADTRIRGYLNQERVIDSASDCIDFDYHPIICDLPLAVGDAFKVGFQNDAALTTDHYITVDFTEE